MEKINVALVGLGDHLPINIDYLKKKLNSLQSSFQFSHETSITSQSLGQPDLDLQWYYLERLFRLLCKHPQYAKFDYIVGITHLRITRKSRDAGDDANKDYFSLSDFRKITVISLNHNVLAFNSEFKNIFQYTAFSIFGELLCNMVKENLYHVQNKYCLFDDCVDRTFFAPSIEKSRLCVQCMNRLKEKGIKNIYIEDTMRILQWCRRNIGTSSLISRTAMDPITNLAIGAGIGWATSAFIGPRHWPIMVAIVCLLMATRAFFYWYIDYEKRKLPG